MPGRILNFSEFFGKYSTDQGDKGAAGFEDFAKASSNFEAGFDEKSYDKTQLGPNKPIQGGEASIPAPGEQGAPVFKSSKPEGMNAPEEQEEEQIEAETEDEEVESPEDAEEAEETEEPEEQDDEESEEEPEESEEEEEDETPEPEMGANPRMKKKTNEQYYPNFDVSTEFSEGEEDEDELEMGANPRFASEFNDFTINLGDLEDENQEELDSKWDESSWEETTDDNTCPTCGHSELPCGCNM